MKERLTVERGDDGSMLPWKRGTMYTYYVYVVVSRCLCLTLSILLLPDWVYERRLAYIGYRMQHWIIRECIGQDSSTLLCVLYRSDKHEPNHWRAAPKTIRCLCMRCIPISRWTAPKAAEIFNKHRAIHFLLSMLNINTRNVRKPYKRCDMHVRTLSVSNVYRIRQSSWEYQETLWI